jgi:hypothetical protein
MQLTINKQTALDTLWAAPPCTLPTSPEIAEVSDLPNGETQTALLSLLAEGLVVCAPGAEPVWQLSVAGQRLQAEAAGVAEPRLDRVAEVRAAIQSEGAEPYIMRRLAEAAAAINDVELATEIRDQ